MLVCEGDGSFDSISAAEVFESWERLDERVERTCLDDCTYAYIMDLKDRRVIYTTVPPEQTLGYEWPELDAMGREAISSLVHPEDHLHVHQVQASYNALGNGFVEMNYRVRCKSGEFKRIESKNYIAMRDHLGLPVLVLGFVQLREL